jgi:hypothetical protein
MLSLSLGGRPSDMQARVWGGLGTPELERAALPRWPTTVRVAYYRTSHTTLRRDTKTRGV